MQFFLTQPKGCIKMFRIIFPFFKHLVKKSGIFPICLDHTEIWQPEILCKQTLLGSVILSSNNKLGNPG